MNGHVRRTPLGRTALLALATLAVACDGGGGGGGGSPTDPGPALAIVASPASIGPSGTSEVLVQATAASGGPGAGLLVELSATMGRLDASEVVTDAQGRATTRLRGDGTAGVSRLRAQVRGTATTATTEVRIGLDRNVRVEVTPAAIAGSQQATIAVTVLEPDGSPAPAGVAVTVATTLGTLAPTQVTTNSFGVARTTLATGGQVGTARLTVTAAGAAAVTVDVPLRAAYDLGLTANPPSIDTAGRSILTLRLLALDPAASAVGVPVQLATTLGRLQAAQVRTDARGTAATLLTADGRTGTATVTATVAGVPAVTTTVQISGGLALQLSVVPALVPANGTATIAVLVTRADGSPAPAGTEVLVATTRGRLDADRLRTDGSGRGATTLRGDGRTGNATVTATIAGTSVRAQQVVTFT